MPEEKRKLLRLRKRLQAKFGVVEPTRIGFTEDFSDTGLFIKSAVVLNPETILRVELIIPGYEPIELTAKVMWAKKVPPNLLARVKGGMGVRILSFQKGEGAYQALVQEYRNRYSR
jgi:hypothetical protein